MPDNFNSIVHKLLHFATPDNPLILGKEPSFFDVFNRNPANLSRSINAAFLIVLCGAKHPSSRPAYDFLQRMAHSPTWKGITRFYLEGIQAIGRELASINQNNAEVAQRLEALAKQLTNQGSQLEDRQLL